MARPLRIEYPGAVYHIISRGNEKKPIFITRQDHTVFLKTLNDVIKEHNWLCHSYCLMKNHYHLLIETIEANLSLGMRQLNGVYTQRFNRMHDRVGHLFQGRFKSILVQKESYLLELCRYIVLNPVRAEITNLPSEYEWSSYKAILGLQKKEKFLTTDWVLSQFSEDLSDARKRYKKFVLSGINKEPPKGEINNPAVLGDFNFIDRITPHIKNKLNLKEIPRQQRQINRPKLDSLFPIGKCIKKKERNKIMTSAYIEYGYKISEIAKAVNLKYTTVSDIIRGR